jgi:copper oxidase (laccase) domain-containing protein
MEQSFGCRPQHILAALGPTIGRCCYEVGADVTRGVRSAFPNEAGLLRQQPDGRWHFDLPAAVRRQLQRSGVVQVEDSGLCTSCHSDEFFSHRADQGRSGRFAVLLGLRSETSATTAL